MTVIMEQKQRYNQRPYNQYNNRQQYEKGYKRPDYIKKFIQFKQAMSEQTEPLVYHSLSRHIQSIPSQAEHLRVFNIYSSNQQPPVPSILQRSRTKKSHQKSLKKGLSRVSKSKTTINIGQGLAKQQHQRQSSKGTLLNFNIQEVVDNKYHITKPRDQVLQISPRKGQTTSMKQFQTSQPGSNQKSFISEYRIVTYVPQGRAQDDRRQSFIREEKQSMKNESGIQQNWDKENNSNYSNVFRNNHQKNDSQSIQIINPTQQNNLQENTWRTSDNFDPYYSNNLGNQINQTNEPLKQTQRQQLYSSLKPKYSVPVSSEVNELRSAITQIGPLRDKIKHLEHQIVQIQREKNILVKNSHQQVKQFSILREQHANLNRQKTILQQQNSSFREENATLREQISSHLANMKRLNQHILNLEQKIAILSHQTNSSKQKRFSQSYLLEETGNKLYSKPNSVQQILRKQIQSLKEGNETLSLAKAKLEKELSEKTLLITQLNRKNKDLTQKISDFERDLRKEKQKIQSQEEKLYRKDQKINSLSLEVDRLNLVAKQLKQRQIRVQANNKSILLQGNNKPTLVEQKQLQTLGTDGEREEKGQNLMKEELEKLRHEYEKLQRDNAHLEKKNMFMKDELEHLKYLQLNASSSVLSHRSNTQNNYNSLNPKYHTTINTYSTNAEKQKQLQQSIYELQTRLQMTERNHKQVEEEYSNLKQNFRALEELYIKQQDQNYQLQQEAQKLAQDNNKLKIELANLQQISKAKSITFNDNSNTSLKLMEKQEQLLRLKKDFSSFQRKYTQLQKKYNEIQRKLIENQRRSSQTQRKYSQTQRKQLQTLTQFQILQTQLKTLKKERDQSYTKYLSELQKNAQLTQRHKQDLDFYIIKMQKEEQQKITIVADKYQALIAQLNQEIQSQKNQLLTIKQTHLNEIELRQDSFLKQLKLKSQAHLDQLTHVEDQHKQEIQTLLNEIDRQQLKHKSQIQKLIRQNDSCKQYQQNNTLIQSKNQTKRLSSQNRFQSATKMSRFLNYESMSRKQLESFTTELQSDFTLVQNKYKTLVIEKQRLQDNLESTSRQITHLEQQIRLYKQQKQNSLKEKYELRQQVQRANMMMVQMKKTVSLFDQQKTSFTSRINELNQKYLLTVQQYQQLIKELKQVKTLLYDKEMSLENYQHDIRELRINLLEEKEIAEKKIREICVLKDEKQALKSKEEYYKMLFEKAQKQLQLQLQQKALFLATHAPKVPSTSSPTKQRSPQKRPSINKLHQVSPKTRQTQLYRIQIFKDLNKLLNLTNQHFTLQQIIEKNQQQYLRMLYNAIKQDHSKITDLKQLIVDMEEGYRKEKVFIKEDYDLLYEKYLKYKNMCQDMNRDIERYKLKLKASKDHHFVNIDL